MSRKPLTRFEKFEREESKARMKLYDLEREKQRKKDELKIYCKRHRSVNFDGLATGNIEKLKKIYSYFDNNKLYIHDHDLGLRCDNRGMALYFWLHNDPDYLVIHLSSNHGNIVFSGSTSWIVKAETLENKVDLLKTIKKDITKLLEE